MQDSANHPSSSSPSHTADRTRILVVDDDSAISELVSSLLEAEGFDVDAFTDPEKALRSFESAGYDLAILDVMMPGIDGFELCNRLRARSDIPIVFLSARDEEIDQVVGLTLGADDYVTKPFKPRELVARVRAHLRRSKKAPASAPSQERTGNDANVLDVQSITVDLYAHEASLHDIPLSLTPKEFAILALLVKNAGKPVPTPKIYEKAWNEPYDPAAANTVMVHIRHLRSKLAKIDSSQEYIETVWGVGYRIPRRLDAAGD